MAEFMEKDCETLDVKEECVEEKDPLMITTNSETGTWDLTKFFIADKSIE